jgi:hypothetical protein
MCAQDFEQPKNMSTQTEPKAIKRKIKNKKECKSFIQPPIEYKSYDQMLY